MHTIKADDYKLEPTSRERAFIGMYLSAVKLSELGQTDFDFDEVFLRESIIDCLAFYKQIACYLDPKNIEQAGYDFWLTRNFHGNGFWTRPELYGERYSEKFTTLAESFGEAHALFGGEA
jgi:hypothetical protein